VAFHVRDPETDTLVRRVARQKGLGLTETIKLVMRGELDREAQVTPLRERIAALRAEAQARPRTGPRGDVDKAFFDDLSGEP
jgi:antitoxin VapB